ncbi:MAG: hypothetical protein EXR12_07835 [Rhodospirillaceae bacterium]|nr:hypothetical protein [Rhodospirillaceae bacterium]
MAKGRLKRPAGPAPAPREIFKQSMRFFIALHGLHLYRREKPDLASALDLPMLVLAAFQSEVAMKALIVAESGVLPGGHDLKELFGKLAPATQAAVEAAWDRLMAKVEPETLELELRLGGKVPRGLHEALEHSKDSFAELRYIYETGDGQSYIGNLPLALSEVAVSLHSDWERL